MKLECVRGEMYLVPHVFNRLGVKESIAATREL